MQTKISLLGNRIAYKVTETQEITAGGIFIPVIAQDEATEGIVVAVGPGKVLESGAVAEMTVKVGDKIFLNKHRHDQAIQGDDGQKYYITNEDAVLGIIDP